MVTEKFYLFKRTGTQRRGSKLTVFGYPTKFEVVDIGGDSEAVRLERVAPLSNGELFSCLDRAREHNVCILGTHADSPDGIEEKYRYVLVPEKYLRSELELSWILEPYIPFNTESSVQRSTRRKTRGRPKTSRESARRVLEIMFNL
ncbi:hypothetical protein G8764_20140 [Pseudomaricurvus alcaniphilus]|nr:hypothetical protein [Pseudomaricurvus alcaniphilus]